MDSTATAPSIRYPLRESPYLRGVRVPFVAVIEHALSPQRCDALVALIESHSPTLATITVGDGRTVVNTRARNNERVVFDDPALAVALDASTRAHLPETLDGATLVGLNERFRGYRYRPGQRFAPHFDGAFARDNTPTGREVSQVTVLFYLNEGFVGGETKLLDYEVTIVPKRGMVLLFEHAMYHEGCEVTDGTKYVLRSDAMYWYARHE